MSKSCKWWGILLLILVLIAGFAGYKVAYKHKAAIKCLFKNEEECSCLKKMAKLERDQKEYLGILVKDNNGNLILADKDDSAVSSVIIKGELWEPHIVNFLNRVLHSGDKIISVGAHIGYHVVQMSKLVGQKGEIYCFEPNPKTFKFLEANLILNDIKNVKLFEKAAYYENTTLKFAAFNVPDSPSGGSHILLNKNHPHQVSMPGKSIEIEVEAITIDSALKNVDNINVLQMDIEGAEPFAVKGAIDLIKRSPNLIVVQEWWIAVMKNYSDVANYIKFWRDLGYNFARIYEDRLEAMTDQELMSAPDLIDVVITKDLDTLQKAYLSNN